MKIASLHFEIVRATPAVAEFLARVQLDGPAESATVIGSAAGPHCPGISTVEVVYPMTVAEVGANEVSLRCVIPEPNLWTPRAPFEYSVSINLMVGDELADSRNGTIILRGAA